jgi:hypothetical protein
MTLKASNSNSHSHVCGSRIVTLSNTGGVEFKGSWNYLVIQPTPGLIDQLML